MFKQSGLSLIELMIAMVIGLVLMLGVSQVFLSTRNVYSNQDAISRLQETGRLAMEFMARDTRMAGYTGCASASASATTFFKRTSSATVFNRLDVGVEGLNNTASVATAYALSPVPVNGSDVLVIRSAYGSGVAVTATNAGTSISVDASSPTAVEAGACAAGANRVSGICPGDTVVISDCAKATVFTVSSIADGGTITATTVIPEEYRPDTDTQAEVVQGNTIIYYVATSPTTGRRGLWQKIGSNAAVELLEGVQDMQILYGRDTGTDDIPDVYQTATTVASAAAWPKVKSVRIQLLAQSIEDKVLPNPQTYTFNGASVTPTDTRMRQVFVSTVGIRSRLK